jgi:hypothetical protein
MSNGVGKVPKQPAVPPQGVQVQQNKEAAPAKPAAPKAGVEGQDKAEQGEQKAQAQKLIEAKGTKKPPSAGAAYQTKETEKTEKKAAEVPWYARTTPPEEKYIKSLRYEWWKHDNQIPWKKLNYSQTVATIASLATNREDPESNKEWWSAHISEGTRTLRDRFGIKGSDEELVKKIRSGEVPMMESQYHAQKAAAKLQAAELLSKFADRAITDLPGKIEETNKEVNKALEENQRQQKDQLEVLGEFTKGVTIQKFGEVLATLPLSFLKAAQGARVMKNILSAAGNISSAVGMGQGSLELLTKGELEEMVKALSPEEQFALQFATSSGAGKDKAFSRRYSWRNKVFDQALKKWDGTIPKQSLWSDAVVRLYDKIRGESESHSDIRDDYVVKLANSTADEAVWTAWHREDAPQLLKGAQGLKELKSKLAERIHYYQQELEDAGYSPTWGQPYQEK